MVPGGKPSYNRVSVGPQALDLSSAQEETAHIKCTEDDSAQQGQHGLEEGPKNQILTRLRPFAPSEASTAAPDQAAFPALSRPAVLRLPDLRPCRITPDEACFPAQYISLYSSQLKLKSRSSTAQQCYFCFILLGRFLCPSFYRSALQHLEKME